MKKPHRLLTLVVLLRADFGPKLNAQAAFTNLFFENVGAIPFPPGDVRVADAIPGWSVSIGTNQYSLMLYDTLFLSGYSVSIQDASSKYAVPIQGQFSVCFQTFGEIGVPPDFSVSIAQTGQVPTNAKSLNFAATGPLAVSFKSSLLPIFDLGGGTTYRNYSADITPYAGQVGELRFADSLAIPGGGLKVLDAIRFSPLSVPEPGTLALLALGGGLSWMVGREKWKKAQTSKMKGS